MSRLSYLIHRLCARRGMQLGELAQRMDVRRTSLSQLLAKDKPKPSTFRKLASALGLDPQMLIDRPNHYFVFDDYLYDGGLGLRTA